MTLGHLDPLYIAPTRKLRDDKEDLFRLRVCMAGSDRFYSVYDGLRPSIIVVDEIGLISGKQLEDHLKYAKENGTRVFLLGDQGQMVSQYCMKDLWKKMSEYHNVDFKHNRRAKDILTKEFQEKIHRASIDYQNGKLDRDAALIIQRELIHTHLRRANRKDLEGRVIKYYNDEKENCTTIDKFQGDTISKGDRTVIWFRAGGGRLDDMPMIINTMVGRFQSIRDIRYVDTTSYKNESG